MKIAVRMVVGATLFAVALLSSSWLLKGHPAGDWVDTALYLGLGCFLAAQTVIALPQVFTPRRHDS